MRVLYGVVGEGMGHAVRSRVVLDHLLSVGHEVEIMASARAADYLSERFPEVHRIHGLHIIYEENRARPAATILSNALRGTAALPKQIKAYFELVADFDPEVVISDFESWSHLFGLMHRLPIISVDNAQVIPRCQHDAEILKGIRKDFELARTFIKSKLAFSDHYVIATFFRPPLRKERTTLVPPILRPRILQATTSEQDHLLVYQTAEGYEALAQVLKNSGMPCRIYGMRRDLKEDVQDENLLFRPFDEQVFVDDLASCRAVVSGGSFTLMGEAVYLHKPMLSVPVGGQVEQVINARYLEREGFGMHAPVIDENSLSAFMKRVPECKARLADYSQDANVECMQTIDELLDRAAAGVLRRSRSIIPGPA
jgi:uncharacterized protein (TIGR00661 family)